MADTDYPDITDVDPLVESLDQTEEVGLQNFIWGQAMESVNIPTGQLMALGGTIMLCKQSGQLGHTVEVADTEIDFGQAMTPGNWVYISGTDADNNVGAVETVLVGAVDATTDNPYLYNVTRNVDGSGANRWPQLMPYVVLGQNGNSRVEITAGAAGTVRVVTQTAVWNVATVQAEMSTVSGAIVAGAGAVTMNVNGLTFIMPTGGSPGGTNNANWTFGGSLMFSVGAFYDSFANGVYSQVYAVGTAAHGAAQIVIGAHGTTAGGITDATGATIYLNQTAAGAATMEVTAQTTFDAGVASPFAVNSASVGSATIGGNTLGFSRAGLCFVGTTDAAGVLVLRSANSQTALTINTSQNAAFAGDVSVNGNFAANGNTVQGKYASGGALAAYGAGTNGVDSGAHMSALYSMVVKIRAALVANGIMS